MNVLTVTQDQSIFARNQLALLTHSTAELTHLFAFRLDLFVFFVKVELKLSEQVEVGGHSETMV